MKMFVFLFPLFFWFESVAQQSSAKEEYHMTMGEYERIKPYNYDPEFSFQIKSKESCDEVRAFAVQQVKRGNLRYVIPVSLFVSDDLIIKGYVLKEQFHVMPVEIPVSCIPTSEFDECDCYNDAVDIYLSMKYKINFPKVIAAKVEDAMKLSKAERAKRYPAVKFFYDLF